MKKFKTRKHAVIYRTVRSSIIIAIIRSSTNHHQMDLSNKTIKGIGLIKAGGVEVLGPIEIPKPKLGDFDILVRVKATGLNPLDYKVRKYSTTLITPVSVSTENPRIPGYDASGIVVEVGTAVKKFKVGDEVFYAGNVQKPGTYAPLHVVDSRIVGHKPKSLSHAEAAGMPLVCLTAWESLIDRLRIPQDKSQNRGKTILIIAAAGGVGSVAIQIAKRLLGLTVIATASRSETVDFVKKLGSDYAINYKNPLAEELEKIGIKEVDYVFHCHELTTDYVKQIGQVIKPGGAVVGITAGEEYDLRVFFTKSVLFLLELMFTRPTYGVELERQGEILETVSKLFDEKVLVHTVTEIKPFTVENVRKAHIKLENGAGIGKIVLDKVDEFQ